MSTPPTPPPSRPLSGPRSSVLLRRDVVGSEPLSRPSGVSPGTLSPSTRSPDRTGPGSLCTLNSTYSPPVGSRPVLGAPQARRDTQNHTLLLPVRGGPSFPRTPGSSSHWNTRPGRDSGRCTSPAPGTPVEPRSSSRTPHPSFRGSPARGTHVHRTCDPDGVPPTTPVLRGTLHLFAKDTRTRSRDQSGRAPEYRCVQSSFPFYGVVPPSFHRRRAT